MHKTIKVTASISIETAEIELQFIRASGPGGQNVNKVATAVQLRFDAKHSASIPETIRDRLLKLAGNQLTKDGCIVITAKRHRTQERNRADAVKRLIDLIKQASIVPKKRKKTRIPKAVKEKRLQNKKNRSQLKTSRKKIID